MPARDITDEIVAEERWQFAHGFEELRRWSTILTLDDGTEGIVGTVVYDTDSKTDPLGDGRIIRTTRVAMWTRAHHETRRTSTILATVWLPVHEILNTEET